MNGMLQVWLVAGGWYPHLTFFAEALAKSLLVFILADAAAILLLRRTPRWARWYWLAIFVLLAVVPFVNLATPRQMPRVDVPVRNDADQLQQIYRTAQDKGWILDGKTQSELNQKELEKERDTAARPAWDRGYNLQHPIDIRVGIQQRLDAGIVPVCVLIAVLGTLWFVVRHLGSTWWLRQRLVAPSDRLRKICNDAASAAGAKRSLDLMLVDAPISPMARGVVRSRLILPACAEEWDDVVLRRVIWHEMAHIRRHDLFWQALTGLVSCWFWWNPFLLLAAARFRSRAEAAADEFVLTHREDPKSYAEMLVNLARNLRARQGVADGVYVVRRPALEGRVRALLAFDITRLRLSWPRRIVLGVAVLAVLLVPTMRLVAVPGAPPSGEKISAEHVDPTLAETLTRFVEMEKKREESIHFLHFVMDQFTTSTLQDGSQVKLPMPSHLEAWVDTWSGKRRFEYKPQVEPWTNGSAPFYMQNVTYIYDGKFRYTIDSHTDLDDIPTMPDNGQYMLFEDGTQNATFALGDANMMLSALRETTYSTMKTDLRAQWATWNGRKVVELAVSYQNQGDRGISQRQLYRLDPEHDLSLCYYEIGCPLHDKTDKPQITYEVQRFEKSTAGFYYPAIYRSTSARTVGQGFTNDAQESVNTITAYDILPSLPAHITDAPKPKGTEYLSDSGSVVQPPDMRVTVVDTQTKQPLANAPVRVRVNHNDEKIMKTDATGMIDIALPKEEVTNLYAVCDHAPYVPQEVSWRKYSNPLRLPAAYTMELATGAPISGRVVDEGGQPIEGADVVASYFAPRDSIAAFTSQYSIFDHTAKTDGQGRWKLDRFPPSLDNLYFRVSHPDFRPTTDMGSSSYSQITQQPMSCLRDGSAVLVLKRGNALAGLVFGADGKPLAGARLVVGKDIWGTNLPEVKTDARGHFSLKGLDSTDTFLTVQAAGHKPQAIPLKLPLDKPLADIHLEKGRILKGHVVDVQGKPCAGLNLTADTWNKLRTISYENQTDANGNFTWDGAPDEPVTFAFGACQNREFLSDIPLQASDGVLTISMKPALHMTAQVVDGKTGRPIEKFRVTPGLIFAPSTYISWQNQNATFESGGVFDFKSERMGLSIVFKIEADGYEPLTSEPYLTTQSDYTATFRLLARAN